MFILAVYDQWLFWGHWTQRDWRSSPRLTRQWLAGLGDDVLPAHYELLKRANAFRGLTGPLRGGNWEVLALLDSAGTGKTRELENRYLFQSVPDRAEAYLLKSQILPWHKNLALAYQASSDQILSTGRAHSLASKLPQVLASALFHNGREVLWRLGLGESVESDLWRRIHDLYRLSESVSVARQPIRLNGNNDLVISQSLYLEVMLLGLVEGSGYSVSQLHVLMHALRYWAKGLRLEAQYDPRRHTHCIDLASGRGAAPLVAEAVRKNGMLYLDIRHVLSALDVAVAFLRSHKLPEGLPLPLAFRLTGYQPLLEDIAEKWGSACCKIPKDEPTLQTRVHVVSHWDDLIEILEHAGKGLSSSRGGVEWRLQRSVGSLHTLSGNDEGLDSGMGQLVALREQTEDDVWQLGVVRWLRFRDMTERMVGVEILGPATRLTRVTRPGESRTQDAILLPKVDSKGIANTVVLKGNGFESGTLLDLHDGKVIYRVKLVDILDAQREWVQGRFDILERVAAWGALDEANDSGVRSPRSGG